MPTLAASTTERLTNIWKQSRIPVLLRKGKGHKLMLKLPYADDNYDWLRNECRENPNYHNLNNGLKAI